MKNDKAKNWLDEEMTSQQSYAIERGWKVLRAKGYNIPEWEYWFDNMGDDTYKLVEQFTKGQASEIISVLKGLQSAIWMGLDLKSSIERCNPDNNN